MPGVPADEEDWLSKAVVESSRSEQWTRLLRTVNDRIQGHVGSMGLPAFADMDEATQAAMVEKEFKEVRREGEREREGGRGRHRERGMEGEGWRGLLFFIPVSSLT
jgi:hypothetical protein